MNVHSFVFFFILLSSMHILHLIYTVICDQVRELCVYIHVSPSASNQFKEVFTYFFFNRTNCSEFFFYWNCMKNQICIWQYQALRMTVHTMSRIYVFFFWDPIRLTIHFFSFFFILCVFKWYFYTLFSLFFSLSSYFNLYSFVRQMCI